MNEENYTDKKWVWDGLINARDKNMERAERAEAELAELRETLKICQDANWDNQVRIQEQEKTIFNLRTQLASKEIVIASRDAEITRSVEQCLALSKENGKLRNWRIRAIRYHPELSRLE